MTQVEEFRPFDEDEERTPADRVRAEANRRRVFVRVVRHAVSGEALTALEIASWHRELFEGLSHVPDPCYLGGYRGSSHPWLAGYEVAAGGARCVRPWNVELELDQFFKTLAHRTKELETAVPPERPKARKEVRQVAELAAWAHGEWIRVHPFANGNGRVARLFANHVLARFRLRPVVRLRPRPGTPYVELAARSMRGDHHPTAAWIEWLLEEGN